MLARRALTIALRTVTAVTGDVDAARDIAQDVTVIVITRHGDLRDEASFDAWVHRIAVRETMSAGAGAGAGGDGSVRRRSTTGWESRTGVMRRRRAWIASRRNAALRQLPERERVALTLRYVHDLSEKEIAAAMRCRRGTAASLLSRGRARLRAGDEILSVLTRLGRYARDE